MFRTTEVMYNNIKGHLKVLFDPEYGGKKSEAKTANLMDYAGGKELAAFQWNIMASPAVFTLLDDDEEGQIRRIVVAPYLFTLRTFHNLNKPLSIEHSNGELDLSEHLFAYKFQNRVFVHYATERMQTQNGAWILPNITFSKQSKHSKFHNATFYQIIISDVGEINCLSEKDRDMIYCYLTGQNDEPIFDQYELLIRDKKYSFALMYRQLERQKRELIASGKYQQLSAEERIILDLPLIMWLKQWYYGSIFMYNWIVGEGDIVMDDAMFAFLDKWEKKVEAEQEFMQFFKSQKNNAIGKEIEKDGHKIYALKDARRHIAQSVADTIRFDSQNFSDDYLNFARCNISKSIYYDKINDEHIASFGTLSILYLFEGKYDRNSNIITVYNLIEKIKDGFDFEDDSTSFQGRFFNFVFDGQPLGAWNNLFESNKGIGFNWLFHFDKKFNLSNGTFISFRNKTNIGKDFRIIGNRKVSSKFIDKIIIKQNSFVVSYF